MPTLRTYQREDVAAVIAAHAEHQCVLGRAATGLGKGLEVAFLAQHYSQFGRVMVLVDVRKLVMQLADTIRWVMGFPPGIEMGDFQAMNADGLTMKKDQVIVSTVQTQYSGAEGNERYRQFNPTEYSALLLDETELFLAPTARTVVEWYRINPKLKVFGCSATPWRTDGTPMGHLFQTVAFDRDIQWGISNGWLVPARQAFVRVDIDFSSLKLAKDESGEKDYRDSELARKLLEDEEKLIGLAKGIIEVAQDRKSIVVCPDVVSAKAITHYLEAEKPGCARVIYGELTDQQKDDGFDGHARNEFQFLVSVMMLTKGYDDPTIKAIFMCRKTRSKRLYQQVLGRGTRPLRGLLNDLDGEDAAPRLAAIAASDKKEMLMCNMVGIDVATRDMTILDILGHIDDPEIMELARKKLMEGKDADAAMDEAKHETEQDRAANRCAAEIARDTQQIEESKILQLRREARHAKADVQVEYLNDLSAPAFSGTGEDFIPAKQLAILRKAKVPEGHIASLSRPEAGWLVGRIVDRWRKGLCSFRQEALLRRAGYAKEETDRMTRDRASDAIDELKSNNWRRVRVKA